MLRGLCEFSLLFAIAVHRTILSPLLGASCRFLPSCSYYAEEAVRVHGPWVGARLAARRLWRCRPWGDFGHDPVPARPDAATGAASRRERS